MFPRYLGLMKRHFSSDILVPFPDSSDFICTALAQKMKFSINTFTANYKLSRSPGFLYFCQLRDNSYFQDQLFLPTTSYLVVTKFIIFANYEITRTTLFLIFHLFTQKRMDFIIFVGKLKTQRILIRVFQTFLSSVFPDQMSYVIRQLLGFVGNKTDIETFHN